MWIVSLCQHSKSAIFYYNIHHGFCFQTDYEQMDNCDCRIAIATENKNKCTNRYEQKYLIYEILLSSGQTATQAGTFQTS